LIGYVKIYLTYIKASWAARAVLRQPGRCPGLPIPGYGPGVWDYGFCNQ